MANRLNGADKMKRMLGVRLPKRFPQETIRALGLETNIDLREVVKRTPYRTGDLRGTVKREGPFKVGRSVTFAIVVGGPKAPYALAVHENLEAIHPIGQAKFLESVIMESRTNMARRVARRLELKRAVA